MPDQITANSETVRKWVRYKTAQAAKARWTVEEKKAKEDLLLQLGYDPEDEKPVPSEVVADDGEPLFEIKVGNRRGLNTTYLKETYPHIYAESESVTHPVSVREL